MNLQQLEYIVAVDKYKSFSRAAETCFITQATLSTMVKKTRGGIESGDFRPKNKSHHHHRFG